MPRSGTNFLADTFKCHADICASPNELWEFPHFLYSEMLIDYVNCIAQAPKAHAFKPELFKHCLGNSWLEYMYEFAGSGKRILLKFPSVKDLYSVFHFFPEAYLVIIVRDGRDIVSSALKAGFVAPPPFRLGNRHSWRRAFKSDFEMICRMYKDAAVQLIAFQGSTIAKEKSSRIRFIKYEDLLSDGKAVVVQNLNWAGLPLERYDWEKYRQMPVRGSSFFRDNKGEMNFADGVKVGEDFKPVGRWHDWSDKQLKLFSKEAGREMRYLGYQLD